MKLGKSILKVGYTDDVNKRMGHYFSANPGFDVLGIREGDEILEDMIQIYLTYLGYQRRIGGRLNEWFVDDPEVQQIFHISRDRLENILWKHRRRIFNLSKRLHLIIFEYLKNKNLSVFQQIKEKVDEFLYDFNSTENFANKLKMYCEFMDQYKNSSIIKILDIYILDSRYRKYYILFGTAGCRARSYRDDRINTNIDSRIKINNLSTKVSEMFKVGKRYSRKDIKLLLSQIYNSLEIKKIAKANDLEKWFEIKEVKFPDATGKWIHGFEILAVKKN